jgi:hypothetical protein
LGRFERLGHPSCGAFSPESEIWVNAAGIAARRPESIQTWKNISAAAGFFAAHKAWAAYVPEAVVGVISDFAGKNKSLSRELLNLLARSSQHYRIIVKDRIEPSVRSPGPGDRVSSTGSVIGTGLTGPRKER